MASVAQVRQAVKYRKLFKLGRIKRRTHAEYVAWGKQRQNVAPVAPNAERHATPTRRKIGGTRVGQ